MGKPGAGGGGEGAAGPLPEATGPATTVAAVLRSSTGTGRTMLMMTTTGRLCASCARAKSSSSRWGSATTPEGARNFRGYTRDTSRARGL